MEGRYTCGVYAIWVKDGDGNELPYVGSSKRLERRRKDHFKALAAGRHCNYKLHRAWKRLGPQAFRFEVLFTCGEAERFIWEELTIRVLNSFHSGYNLTPNALNSPNFGIPLSDKTKRRMALAARKRYKDASEHEKTSRSLKEFWSNTDNRERLWVPS